MSGREVLRGGVPRSEAEGCPSAATPGDAPFARAGDLTPAARRRLRVLLVAKAALETLFVLALVAAFFYVNWNPSIEGAVTSADSGRVEGWVSGARDVEESLEVQLFVDGKFAASAQAENAFAPGEGASGGVRPARARGFSLELPTLAEGEHEARVYAVHVGGGRVRRALHEVGGPVRLGAGGVR